MFVNYNIAYVCGHILKTWKFINGNYLICILPVLSRLLLCDNTHTHEFASSITVVVAATAATTLFVLRRYSSIFVNHYCRK